jgi:hypothetical protein
VLLSGIDRLALLNAVQLQDLANPDCKSLQYDQERLTLHALEVVRDGFSDLKLQEIEIKGNIAHSVRSTPHLVVLRCLNQIIRQSVKIEPSDRDTIIRCLATVLAEGVPHRLYKFDIKSFFESIDTPALFQQLANEPDMPRSAVLVLNSYLNLLLDRNIRGVPRGIQLSATLSEYIMKQFDEYVSRLPEVYFYARYVDDIVIVTGAREDKTHFARQIKRQLPRPLEFNTTKTRVLDIPVQKKSDGLSIVGDFDYLGYNFSIHESARIHNRLCRSNQITIAPRKVRRLKSRLCRAVTSFIVDNNISLLERRLQLLTGNYNLRDISTGRLRNVGLYCNYRRANSTASLIELDSFFRSLVIGNRSRIARRLSTACPTQERRSLLRFSFAKGFTEQIFYNFPSAELAELTLCWRDA